MKAKVSFAIAAVLGALGLALMGMSFSGASALERMQSGWDKKLKDLDRKIEDERFPNDAYIRAFSEHGEALTRQNAEIWSMLKALNKTLELDLPEEATQPEFEIAWNQASERLQGEYRSMVEDLDWASTKSNPLAPQRGIGRGQAQSLRRRYWIGTSLLAALQRGLAGADPDTLEYNQRVSITAMSIERPEGRTRGGDDLPYEIINVELAGNIPYPVLARALDDLASPLSAEGKPEHPLFELTRLEVKRSEADPDKPTVQKFDPKQGMPESRTGAPLQNQVEASWRVRIAKEWQAPEPE